MKADARALSQALALCLSQDTECDARPLDGGWQLSCMSPDGVTLCDVRVKREAFPKGVDGTPEEFVVDTDRWLKALRTVGPTAEVEFIDGRVRLSGRGLRHTFRLAEVRDRRNKFRMPDLSARMTAQCMVETERLRTLLSSVDTKKVDELRVVIRPEGLMVTAYDDALDGADLTVPPEECAILTGQASAAFPAEAWMDLMRASSADVVQIDLGDDVPAMAEFGDTAYDCRWLCAPRIQQG